MRSLPVLTLLLLTAPLGAQYRRQLGDVSRVREETRTSVTLDTPQGVLEFSTDQVATIAVRFEGADSASAWYDSLLVHANSPMGRQAPPTQPLIGKPYALRFDARGRISTLATPEMPPALTMFTDLTRQFDDLFLRLPNQPLQVGTSWEDTVTLSKNDGGRRMRSVRRGTYRVVRDTTVSGTLALVIEVAQELELESTQAIEGQPLTATTQLAGRDDGFFVFAPALGKQLGRRRSGEMEGSVEYTGGPGPMRMAQRMRYTNTVDAVPTP